MNKTSFELSQSLQDKHTEVHYNEKYIKNVGGQRIHINMQGKIKCPAINESISSIVCAKLMDKTGWPREIDPEICKKCNCFIHLSIAKFSKVRKN